MSPILISPAWLARDFAIAAGREFPPPTDPRWHTFTGEQEQGKQEGRAELAGPRTRAVHDDLADPSFLEEMDAAFGYTTPTLLADPTRVGGGIHQCAPGGRLALHTDFNVHPEVPHYIRAVNVIVFVGELGIGSADPGALVMRIGDHDLRIAPAPGTLVAWKAEAGIYHGHPEPMRSGQPIRRSIPAYLYRTARPGETIAATSTEFLQ